MMKVLLLENIHQLAVEIFRSEGFEVEHLKGALKEDELIAKLPGVQILGIRSKTQLTEKIFDHAPDLLAVGAFCVGTNQIDVSAAQKRGVPVFNAPFSNTRSVAEMVISEIVMLSRQIGTRNNELHAGIWNKTSAGCFEVRGKTLGIVGYGKIGTQVSTLAESMGMRVLYFDIVAKLPLGNAKPMSDLNTLLAESDFVTLHVPETPQTMNMIGAEQLARMREGAYLMNLSRGTVVDVPALAEALKSKHLAGAAIDVFPWEPEVNSKEFKSPLLGLSNVVLTPHIGGATEEAQVNIGREVSALLSRFGKIGTTMLSVNFPNLELAPVPNTHRIINVHRNVPGVLKEINRIVSDAGANIEGQALATDPVLGYLIMDLNHEVAGAVKTQIEGLKTSIKTRIIS